MVREYPALVITDARDLSKNSGNPAFASIWDLVVPVTNGTPDYFQPCRSAIFWTAYFQPGHRKISPDSTKLNCGRTPDHVLAQQ